MNLSSTVWCNDVSQISVIGQICSFLWTCKTQRAFSFSGLCPWPTTGTLPLDLCWGFYPQTPIIASLSKLAMANPARALHTLRLALHDTMTVETRNMLCLCVRLVHHWRKNSRYYIQRWYAQVPVAALRRRLLFSKVKSQSVQACWQLSTVQWSCILFSTFNKFMLRSMFGNCYRNWYTVFMTRLPHLHEWPTSLATLTASECELTMALSLHENVEWFSSQ